MKHRTALIILAAFFFLPLFAAVSDAHPAWEDPYYFVKRTYNLTKQTVDWQIIEEGGVHWGHTEGNDRRNWRYTFKTRAEAEKQGREIDAENARISKEGQNPLSNTFLNGAANFETAYSQAGLKGTPGTFEKLTAELLQSVSDFLVRFLGLSTMEELVYNQGARTAYIYGIFPKDKWAANQTVYLKFYTIAWLLMFLPPVWIFMKKALSTVNPGIRSSFKGSLLTYFISMAMMGAVFPVIHFFFWINDSLVRAFYDENVIGFFHDAVPGEGFLGAAVVRLAFLALTLYYNFTYRVRCFVLGLLMVMAPVFIFFVNFDKTRYVTATFLKELIYNIFVQSFHAVSLFYFVSTLGVSGIWDKIVLLMVFIPLTELLRRMIMGPGSAGGHLAAVAGMATVSMAANVLRSGRSRSTKKSLPAEADDGNPTGDGPTDDRWPQQSFKNTLGTRSAPGGAALKPVTRVAAAAGRAAATVAGASMGLPFGPTSAFLGAGAGYQSAEQVGETAQSTASLTGRTVRRILHNRPPEEDHKGNDNPGFPPRSLS